MSRVVINGESADYFNTIEGVLYSSRFGAEVMLYGKMSVRSTSPGARIILIPCPEKSQKSCDRRLPLI